MIWTIGWMKWKQRTVKSLLYATPKYSSKKKRGKQSCSRNSDTVFQKYMKWVYTHLCIEQVLKTCKNNASPDKAQTESETFCNYSFKLTNKVRKDNKDERQFKTVHVADVEDKRHNLSQGNKRRCFAWARRGRRNVAAPWGLYNWKPWGKIGRPYLHQIWGLLRPLLSRHQ